jgi:hypothetical protein
MAASRKQRVGDLLDAGVDAAHHGNAVHQLVPLPDPPLAKHVGDEDTGGKYDNGHQDDTQARHVAQAARQEGGYPGSPHRRAPATARKMPSSMPISHIRIQTVMPMGNHTSSPVMKYCWMRRFMTLRVRRSEERGSVAGTGAAATAHSRCGAASALAGGASAGVALVAAGAPAPPPLKSVAYQPDPLSWKPAAVNCLRNEAAPQAGQSVSGASDIFCRTSLACPQDSHW